MQRDVSPELNDAESPECPVCANGDMPTGAHKCAVCSVPVHILSQCSKPCPGEEEGYGEKRICKKCCILDKRHVESVVALQEKENWGGHAEEAKTTKKEKGRR